jgi:uncharacterized membrane-anchored protein
MNDRGFGKRLAAMITDKQWTLNTGTPVVLQTEPVDPRSLFMGDYARLAYPINRLRLDGETALGGEKVSIRVAVIEMRYPG